MRNIKISPAERLIVAVDIDSGYPKYDRKQLIRFARSLRNKGVWIKVNFMLGYWGYCLIRDLKDCGVRVFVDPKLTDIPKTMEKYADMFLRLEPDMLTVMCQSGVDSMRAVKKYLPDTKVIGVTILTSQKETEVLKIYKRPIASMVRFFSEMAAEAGVDGIVCSPKEARSISKFAVRKKLSIVAANVRPDGFAVEKDGQNPERAGTVAQAIKSGSTYIIVGSPITRAHRPYDAAMKVIDQIAAAR